MHLFWRDLEFMIVATDDIIRWQRMAALASNLFETKFLVLSTQSINEIDSSLNSPTKILALPSGSQLPKGSAAGLQSSVTGFDQTSFLSTILDLKNFIHNDSLLMPWGSQTLFTAQGPKSSILKKASSLPSHALLSDLKKLLSSPAFTDLKDLSLTVSSDGIYFLFDTLLNAPHPLDITTIGLPKLKLFVSEVQPDILRVQVKTPVQRLQDSSQYPIASPVIVRIKTLQNIWDCMKGKRVS